MIGRAGPGDEPLSPPLPLRPRRARARDAPGLATARPLHRHRSLGRRRPRRRRRPVDGSSKRGRCAVPRGRCPGAAGVAESEQQVVAAEIRDLVARPRLSLDGLAERIGTSASRTSTYRSGTIMLSAARWSACAASCTRAPNSRRSRSKTLSCTSTRSAPSKRRSPGGRHAVSSRSR